jgi:4-alpha-glucanotransferase
MMNLVSSHDVPRIMTALSKPCDTDDRDIQRGFKVSSRDIDRISALAKMAFAFQTCYIGASCIYYGDEILMEGYKDPFNRRTYPWHKTGLRQQESFVFFKRIAGLRSVNQCLKTGFYKTLMAEGGSFAIARYLKEGKDAFGREASGSKGIVLVMNRSAEPLFVDVRENYGAYTCVRTGDDEARPPLSEQLIVGGVTGGVKKLGIKPYSTVFLVY